MVKRSESTNLSSFRRNIDSSFTHFTFLIVYYQYVKLDLLFTNLIGLEHLVLAFWI